MRYNQAFTSKVVSTGGSGGPQTPLSVVDTSTVDLSTSGADQHTLQASVRLSSDPGNTLEARVDGMYVPPSAGTYSFSIDTPTDPAATVVSGDQVRFVGLGLVRMQLTSSPGLHDIITDIDTTTATPGQVVSWDGLNVVWTSIPPNLSLPIVETAVDYTVLPTDHTVVVDATTGPVVVTLPAPSVGRVLAIKKVDTTVNTVTLLGSVDGLPSYVLLNPREAVHLHATATTWVAI